MNPKFSLVLTRIRIVTCCFAVSVFMAGVAIAQDALPKYSGGEQRTENITSVGSDSMGGLMRRWVEAYQLLQPNVTLRAVSRGSATAPPALIEGSADIGPMAREMKTNEKEEFIAHYGFEPTAVRTAIAAVAIYVEKENPLTSISFSQLERIYSASPRRDSSLKPAIVWGDLGVKGPYASKKIVAFGRSEGSYLRDYFRQQVLLQGVEREGVMTTASASGMLEAIEANTGAISFGEVLPSSSNKLAKLKILPVRRAAGDSAEAPTLENLLSEKYPLSRFLNVYLVREPGEAPDEGISDFLSFVLSQQGQDLVRQSGLVPLPLESVLAERKKLN
jgi:phosphate transport system substrate-binding protein